VSIAIQSHILSANVIETKITDTTGNPGDNYGYSVAISGKHAIGGLVENNEFSHKITKTDSFLI
jgi:hypothetical protein